MGRTAHPRVLLVSMPWGALERPSLGLALLQSAAQEYGVECDTSYLGFELADRIGTMLYQWIVHTVPYEAFVGDWLFTDALYGPDPERDRQYHDRILTPNWLLAEDEIATLDRVRPTCTRFVHDMATTVDWAAFDVVGFTSTFQQNIASLAMAARVKADHASTTIVFGGANWEGEMGVALHEQFDFVDVVCSGESDRSFVAVLDALWAGDAGSAESLGSVGGIAYRTMDGARVRTEASEPIDDLDSLPIPDFAPFFDAFVESGAADELAPNLLIETARGCWWGAHSHCTFCGLNGASMSFRSKSPHRVLAELDELLEQWGIPNVSVVDNILDMRYFRTLLPELATGDRDCQFFWEVKANLSRSQVQLLADAGVGHVQPGIESMSDAVLELMRKGTTRLRNIAMLKWCKEYGIVPEWNVLFGFPGETAEDYDDMARAFAALHHLQPPSGHGQIRLDRFSPFHDDPESFGMVNVRPSAPFQHLYRVDDDVLDRISYYFEFDYADGRVPASYVAGVLRAIETWKRRHEHAELWVVGGEDGRRVIVDRRGRRERTATLTGWKAAVYDACDRARSRAELAQLDVLDGVPDAEVDRFIERCRTTGLMIGDASGLLATAVSRPARRDPTPQPIRRIPVAASVPG